MWRGVIVWRDEVFLYVDVSILKVKDEESFLQQDVIS